MRILLLFISLLSINAMSQNSDPYETYYKGKIIAQRIVDFPSASQCILTMRADAGYDIGLMVNVMDCENNADLIEDAIDSKRRIAVAESNTYFADMEEVLFGENFYLIIHDINQFL